MLEIKRTKVFLQKKKSIFLKKEVLVFVSGGLFLVSIICESIVIIFASIVGHVR